jgi:hypothetical protein
MADRAAKPVLTTGGRGAATGVRAAGHSGRSTRINRAAADVLSRSGNDHPGAVRAATADAVPHMLRGLLQRLTGLSFQSFSQHISRSISPSVSQCISRRTSDEIAPGAPLHAARTASPGAAQTTPLLATPLLTAPGSSRLIPLQALRRPGLTPAGIKPPGALARATARPVRPPLFPPVFQRASCSVRSPAYARSLRHVVRPLAASLLLAAGLALSLGSPASAGALERACNASGQQGSNRNLCGCIQQVADLTLTGREQKLAAGFFKDPQKAQVMRQSARRRDERFWQKYTAFGESAALYCS